LVDVGVGRVERDDRGVVEVVAPKPILQPRASKVEV